jgi:hypothetical protein
MHRRGPPPKGIHVLAAGPGRGSVAGRSRTSPRGEPRGQPQRRRDDHAGRQQVAGDLHRAGECAGGLEDDRPEPHGLLDDHLEGRVSLGVATVRGRLGLTLELRAVGQLVECPGQRGGGCLVPGQQEGDELVAKLSVGEGTAVVLGVEQPREPVTAFGRVGVAAAIRDLGVEELVETALRVDIPAPGLDPLEDGHLPGQQCDQVQVRYPGDQRPQLVDAAASVTPKTTRMMISRVIACIVRAPRSPGRVAIARSRSGPGR